MRKYTQGQIRQLLTDGIVADLEKAHGEHVERTGEYCIPNLVQVGYSAGVYGINGATFKDGEGRSYGIVGRSSLLFMYS